jgi:hypothetical protein
MPTILSALLEVQGDSEAELLAAPFIALINSKSKINTSAKDGAGHGSKKAH